ncbi:MAG: hypothetical protein WCP36_11875, partial [Methanomicrobiales archaeon]
MRQRKGKKQASRISPSGVIGLLGIIGLIISFILGLSNEFFVLFAGMFIFGYFAFGYKGLIYYHDNFRFVLWVLIPVFVFVFFYFLTYPMKMWTIDLSTLALLGLIICSLYSLWKNRHYPRHTAEIAIIILGCMAVTWLISPIIITPISEQGVFPKGIQSNLDLSFRDPVPALISTGSTQTPYSQVIPTTNVPNYNTLPKQHALKYSSSGDTIKFTTYGGVSDFFSSKPLTFYQNMDNEVLLPRFSDETHNSYMQPLINEIKSKSSDQKKQAMIAIGLVQHLNYGTGAEWEYPYTAIHLERGVCGDKSWLLGYLLKQLGYDVVIFNFKDHAAIGIKSNGVGTFKNSGYAYVESTGPTIPTVFPFSDDPQINGKFEVIHLTNGGKSIDFTEEYNDAQRYT